MGTSFDLDGEGKIVPDAEDIEAIARKYGRARTKQASDAHWWLAQARKAWRMAGWKPDWSD